MAMLKKDAKSWESVLKLRKCRKVDIKSLKVCKSVQKTVKVFKILSRPVSDQFHNRFI